MTWTSSFRLPWRMIRPFALVDVGGAPRGVEVVQRDGAVLDVGSGAHLLGRADQHGDVPGPARGEQAGQVGVGLRLVHEPDGLAGNPAGGEHLAELAVGVPPRPWGSQVAEHQLQRPAHRVRRAVRCLVLVVAVGVPDRADPAGGRGDLAGHGLRQAGQAQVQGGAAAVAGDLDHVVVLRRDGPGADRLSPPAEVGDVAGQLLRRRDRDGLGRAAAVTGPGCELRDGQAQVGRGLDVGEHVPHAEHLRHVAEPGEPALDPEAVAALGCQLDLRDDLAEGGRPGVEHRYPGGLEHRCITYASVTEFAIGVAVANVTTRAPLRRRR